MRRDDLIIKNIDWITVGLFYCLAIMGWLNIYAAIYDADLDQSMFGILQNKAGTQFLWIIVSTITIIFILLLDFRIYFTVPYLVYGLCMFLLVLVLIIGHEIKGNQSWIKLGPISLQPAEFAKVGVAMALAKYISDNSIKYVLNAKTMKLAGIILLAPILILLQPDTGSALVFSSFVIVLYLDGLPDWIPGLGLYIVGLFILTLIFDQFILAGIFFTLAVITLVFIRKNKKKIQLLLIGLGITLCTIFGTSFFVNHVLQPHQQSRIKILLDPESDPKGAGWNIIQSRIAISDGGLSGKGYQKGLITKGNFVPEQHTDFIFCTIGEEHGFIGTTMVIFIYLALLLRLTYVAARQKSHFSRIYGYSVASILFFHFTINIGMTIGLFPVIGIPLPFFSYGGSSLWSFSILLFIFLKLDLHRSQILAR